MIPVYSLLLIPKISGMSFLVSKDNTVHATHAITAVINPGNIPSYGNPVLLLTNLITDITRLLQI